MSKDKFFKFLSSFFNWQHVIVWVVLAFVFTGAGLALGYGYVGSGFWSYGNSGVTAIPADQFYPGSGFICENVNNSSGATYFIPTKQSHEWAAFTANLPAGVTLSACSGSGYYYDGYRDYDRDGFGVGAYGSYQATTSYSVASKGGDCNDNYADVFPGNASSTISCTYSSTCAGFFGNNHNGGDHNCDSSVVKGVWQNAPAVPYNQSTALPTSLYLKVNGFFSSSPGITTSSSCGTTINATNVTNSDGSWYLLDGAQNPLGSFYGGAQVLCQ